jgi:hypothetical protein
MDSFRQVLRVEASVQGVLATRAQERLDDLRFRNDVFRNDARLRSNRQGC